MGNKETQEIVEEKGTEKLKSRKGSKKETDLKIQELEQELSESRDKFLRLFAEFDNFKKRNMKERLDLMRSASQDVLQSLLPVLDDFDRAKKSADDEDNAEQFSEGVSLVYNKLTSTLNSKGLKKMESTGEVFDPELHEAITELPAPSKAMKGRVIETIEQGYYLNEKIIRHAKVVVAK